MVDWLGRKGGAGKWMVGLDDWLWVEEVLGVAKGWVLEDSWSVFMLQAPLPPKMQWKCCDPMIVLRWNQHKLLKQMRWH
jgi:hypothetical protein